MHRDLWLCPAYIAVICHVQNGAQLANSSMNLWDCAVPVAMGSINTVRAPSHASPVGQVSPQEPTRQFQFRSAEVRTTNLGYICAITADL